MNGTRGPYDTPNGWPLVAFGSNANCTIEICGLDLSILRYQPSWAGNGVIVGAFALAGLVHIIQGIRWRSWGFMIAMVLGIIDEIIGYIGRFGLNTNPYSYNAFIIQIVCITTAPVFFCSAIYVQLSRTINHLDRSLSRLNPKFFIWFFIPCDILSLLMQGAGGALSAIQASSGNKTGVNLSLAGLVLQVVTLVFFVGLFTDYVFRYKRKSAVPLQPRMKLFLGFLFLSIIFVLVRCVYRIDELSDGYDGPLIRNEPLFMVLESTMMVLAVICLNIGHPGPVIGKKAPKVSDLPYGNIPPATMQQKYDHYPSSDQVTVPQGAPYRGGF